MATADDLGKVGRRVPVDIVYGWRNSTEDAHTAALARAELERRDEKRPMRRTRRPRAVQRIGSYRETPGYMLTNPNRGKHHSAPATARVHSFTSNESDRIREARREYVPLTVVTPLHRDARGRMLPEPRRTSSAYVI